MTDDINPTDPTEPQTIPDGGFEALPAAPVAESEPVVEPVVEPLNEPSKPVDREPAVCVPSPDSSPIRSRADDATYLSTRGPGT